MKFVDVLSTFPWLVREEYGQFGVVLGDQDVANGLADVWGHTEVNYLCGSLYHVAFPESVQRALSKEVEEELLSFANAARKALGAKELSSLPYPIPDTEGMFWRFWKAMDVKEAWLDDIYRDSVAFCYCKEAAAVGVAWKALVREEEKYDEGQTFYRYFVAFPDRLYRIMEIIYPGD